MAFKTSFAPIPGGFYAVVELRQGGTLIQSRKISDLSPDANDQVSISLNDVPAGTFSITFRFMSLSTDLALAEATYANVAVSAGKTTAVSGPPVMNRSFDEDGDGHNNVDEVRMGTDPRNSFVFPSKLTVDKTGNGTVTSSPSGINCGADCTEAYIPGTGVILTALPDSGERFVGWGGECSGTSTCTVVMSAAKTVTATFTATLSVTKTGNGVVTSSPSGINCGTDCTEAYLLNTVVDLNPSPSLGFLFVGWGGECSGTSTCKVIMSTAKNVTATFAAAVTLSVTKTGIGSVTSNPPGINCGTDCTEIYPMGTKVELTPSPADPGLPFLGWGGECSGTSTCTVVMSAAKTVTATFTGPLNLSNDSNNVAPPEIAVSGSTILVTWTGSFGIFLARSTDGGATFAGSVNFPANSGFSRGLQIAVSGSTVGATWIGPGSGGTDIFFARSTDGGATFANPVNLSADPGDVSGIPQIAVSGATILVAWNESSRILLARSTDGGVTFASPVNLSVNPGNLQRLQIAISGLTILVTWRDVTAENSNIFLTRSTDGGATFAVPFKLSNSSGSSSDDHIAIFGSTVLVVLQDQDNTSGNSDIFLARSTDEGTTFSTPANISANSGFSLHPQIAVSGSTVLVTWEDSTPGGSSDIFLSRSPDGGATFATPVNLSATSNNSTTPQMAISGATVLVTWQDNTAGNGDIFLSRSTDGGTTFANPINLSANSGSSSNPQIAISGTTALVTWKDSTPGNDDIFFLRMEGP